MTGPGNCPHNYAPGVCELCDSEGGCPTACGDTSCPWCRPEIVRELAKRAPFPVGGHDFERPRANWRGCHGCDGVMLAAGQWCFVCKRGLGEATPATPGDYIDPMDTQVGGDPKPRWSLLPFAGLTTVVEVLTISQGKYDDGHWRTVGRIKHFDAAMRHLAKWRSGTRTDDETGKSHVAHAAARLLFILALDVDQ